MSALVIKAWRADIRPIDKENNFVFLTGRQSGLVSVFPILIGPRRNNAFPRSTGDLCGDRVVPEFRQAVPTSRPDLFSYPSVREDQADVWSCVVNSGLSGQIREMR